MAATTRRNSPWMERVYELVANGPRRRNEVILEVVDLVPPGRADRAWQGQKAWLAKDRGYLSNQRSLPGSDRSIRAGARMLVQQSIWSAARRGRIVLTRDENGDEWVSLGRPVKELTPEQYSEAARKANAAMSPERRHEIRVRTWATMPEDSKERVRRGRASLTPEQRMEASRKGWLTRRQHYTAEEIARQSTKKGLRRAAGPPETAIQGPTDQADER